MPFPFHDRNWCEPVDFVRAHARAGERILANDVFWCHFDEIHRYASLHLNPGRSYDWVLLHKGELTNFPMDFLRRLSDEMWPVFANEVFIVWSRDPSIATVEQSPDVTCFDGLLEIRREQAFTPQAIDAPHLPDPARITQFHVLSKQELADAMDGFFRAGGYQYPTPRDQAFCAELDRWLRCLLPDSRGKAMLDVACGNGRMARVISEFASLLEVDLSPEAVRLAGEAGAKDPRRRAVVMDAEALELPDSSMDLVTFIEGAEHVHDLARALREIARVLKPGGCMIMNCANTDSLHHRVSRALGLPYFNTNYQHIREYNFATVEVMLSEAGMVVEQCEGIFLFPYWGLPGVDQQLRHVVDTDLVLVES